LRWVRVQILTNSLESTPDLVAQSAYQPYRALLLDRNYAVGSSQKLSRLS